MTNANETTMAGLSGYGSLTVGSNYIQTISNRNNSSLWVMLEAELIFKSFDSNLVYGYYPIDYICGTYKKFDASVIKYSLPIKSSWFVNPADDETYFLDNDGKVITGWQVVDGDLKYFNETNNYIPNLYEDGATSKKSGERPYGALCKNEMTPSGLFVDEEGEPK